MESSDGAQFVGSGEFRVNPNYVEKYGEDLGAFKVRHGGETLYFSPTATTGTYRSLSERLSSEGLERPTLGQTASLVYTAWQNPESKYSAEVLSKLKNRWLWAFSRKIYARDGVYIADDNGKIPLETFNLSELEKHFQERISNGKNEFGVTFSNDRTVRFVHRDNIKSWDLKKDLSKDALLIGLADIEGAEKLNQFMREYSKEECIYVHGDILSKPKTSVFTFGNTGASELKYSDHSNGNGHCICEGYTFGFSRSAVKFAHQPQKKSLIDKMKDLISRKK